MDKIVVAVVHSFNDIHTRTSQRVLLLMNMYLRLEEGGGVEYSTAKTSTCIFLRLLASFPNVISNSLAFGIEISTKPTGSKIMDTSSIVYLSSAISLCLVSNYRK